MSAEQFTVTREMLTAVARDQRVQLKVADVVVGIAFFKICFCFVLLYNKSLNRISMFPATSSVNCVDHFVCRQYRRGIDAASLHCYANKYKAKAPQANHFHKWTAQSSRIWVWRTTVYGRNREAATGTGAESVGDTGQLCFLAPKTEGNGSVRDEEITGKIGIGSSDSYRPDWLPLGYIWMHGIGENLIGTRRVGSCKGDEKVKQCIEDKYLDMGLFHLEKKGWKFRQKQR